MSDEARSDPDDDLAGWYAAVADALREKSPDVVGHELPGLVDAVAEEDRLDVDHYVVGVSFTKQHACFDYAVDAVRETEGDRVVETIKPPASESHRYVRFTHPPDPYFDASALRARLVAALDEGRREAVESAAHRPGFAELWEEL